MATILLVDDNAVSRELMAAVLEPAGHELWHAASAEEALEKLTAVRPDLILTDIGLPGMDGLALARRVKGDPRLRSIPLMAITAHAMPEDEEAARVAGCDGYLAKPVRPRQLLEAVARLVGAPPDLGQLLAESTRDGIAVCDENGRLVSWNPAARTITGWSHEVAARFDLSAIGEGVVELPQGKWIDVRRLALERDGRRYSAIVFSDCTAQVELREARRTLEEVALIDALTHLPRRPLALDHLSRAIALARRDERSVGIIVIRVAATEPAVSTASRSDEVYRQIARRLLASLRASDFVARVSDDAFAVVLTAMATVDDARVVAVRLLLALAPGLLMEGPERSVANGIGVAAFPRDGATADALLGAAEAAAEAARSSGVGYRMAGAPD